MSTIHFELNGEDVRAEISDPCLTLLDWLRGSAGLTGTKEGCNEGDCGACTVMLRSAGDVWRTMNACILFMPQIHGRHIRTVEGIAGPGGCLHPVQEAMIAEHASQCGYCTPGFVVSLAAAHHRGSDVEEAVAGNLCRCTGYASIMKAARRAAETPRASWLDDNQAPIDVAALDGEAFFAKDNLDAFAHWYAAHPDATLVGGATDVGLWVNKQLRKLLPIGFVGQITELRRLTESRDRIRIGAAVTLQDLGEFMKSRHPSFAELIRRFGSLQVRNAATIGGNIANGSPIGDAAPALIALGCRLVLRRGAVRRILPLEDFFLDYGKQDRAAGEFVEALEVERQADSLYCWKVSKRFDQDISAVCGCFNLPVEGGRITAPRIAFGGLAATTRRSPAAEAALAGQPWSGSSFERAAQALDEDFSPISDMRASADYRRWVAHNLLVRTFRAGMSDGAEHVLAIRA